MASARPEMSTSAAPLQISDGTRRLVVFGAMTALFLAAIDQTVVATAFPRILTDLGHLNLLSWVFTSYMLASTVTVPLAGRLGDQFGRKPLFLIGVTAFVLASMASGAAQSMLQLVIMRGLQGAGSGVIFATTFAVTGDLYAPRDRGKIQGAFAGTFAFASVVGPTLGGWITEAANWRWVFYINVPLGVISVLVITLGMPLVRSERRRPQIDYLGSALLVVAIVPLLMAFVWGGDKYPWLSAQTLGLLGIAVAGTALFIAQESRASEPIIPLELFTHRTVVVSSAVLFLVGAGMFGAVTLVPLFLQGVVGVHASNSGTLMTPMTLMIALGSATSGQIMSRTGRYKMLALIGPLVMLVGLFCFSRMTPDTSRASVVGFMVLTGIGVGCTFPIYNVVVQNALPFSMLGVATSTVQFFRSIGATVGVAVLTGLMLHQFRDGVGAAAAGVPQIAASPNALLNERGVEQLRRAYEASASTSGANFDQVLTAVRAVLSHAITGSFAVGAVAVLLAFVVTLALPEIELQRAGAPSAEPQPTAAH